MPDDLILIVVLVVLVVGVAAALFSRRGSGISDHPTGQGPGPRRPP